MSRPECRGERLERQGEAVACPGVDCGREAPLLVCEESWMARVEILTRICEETIRWCPQCRGVGTIAGINPWEIGGGGSPEPCPSCGALRARLRDLTEEEGET